MGTNFYFKGEVPECIRRATEENETFQFNRSRYGNSDYWGDGEYGIHIGKRSAAGRYCWDCGQTLCAGGNEEIHRGRSSFYEACPKCGKQPSEARIGEPGNAAGMELGFAKPRANKPTGVGSCSSFSWAIDPEAFKDWAEEHRHSLFFRACIKDEYDRSFTLDEFLTMLECNCPIQFDDSMGIPFS